MRVINGYAPAKSAREVYTFPDPLKKRCVEKWLLGLMNKSGISGEETMPCWILALPLSLSDQFMVT